MWRYRVLLWVACVCLVPGAMAGPGAGGEAAAARAARLDALFADLADAGSPQEALRIEFDIWDVWKHPADPAIDRLMQEALTARDHYDYRKALMLFEQVSRRAPEYAEPWNQRATIHFELGDYEQSLQEIAETLAREPRHFGALAGRGLIRIRQGQQALGCQSIRAAARIHPYIPERYLCPPRVDVGAPD